MAELNIRGSTNTRLDSPTADPSVGTFVRRLYMGRTGDLNTDFYDIGIEVIRGRRVCFSGKNLWGARSASSREADVRALGQPCS